MLVSCNNTLEVFLCFQEQRQDIRLRPLNILPLMKGKQGSFFGKI